MLASDSTLPFFWCARGPADIEHLRAGLWRSLISFSVLVTDNMTSSISRIWDWSLGQSSSPPSHGKEGFTARASFSRISFTDGEVLHCAAGPIGEMPKYQGTGVQGNTARGVGK